MIHLANRKGLQTFLFKLSIIRIKGGFIPFLFYAILIKNSTGVALDHKMNSRVVGLIPIAYCVGVSHDDLPLFFCGLYYQLKEGNVHGGILFPPPNKVCIK